jgi:hypothetical protein
MPVNVTGQITAGANMFTRLEFPHGSSAPLARSSDSPYPHSSDRYSGSRTYCLESISVALGGRCAVERMDFQHYVCNVDWLWDVANVAEFKCKVDMDHSRTMVYRRRPFRLWERRRYWSNIRSSC